MVNASETSDRRSALRGALIASAARIIGERGYQALRARELATEVGCALGAIYGVFPDLDALIVAVKARTLDELDAEVARRLAVVENGLQRPPTIDDAKKELQTLAQIYLTFASAQTRRWQALFEHRSAGADMPPDYVAKLDRIFAHIERPLETIAPAMSANARRLFARALFSAVHGIVALGLDDRPSMLPTELLAWQVRAVVEAAACGVADHPEIVSAAGSP